MVGGVSYKMFAVVVACKKEDGREKIVHQRGVDIGKSQKITLARLACLCLYSTRNTFPMRDEVGEPASYEGAPSPWRYLLLPFHAVVRVDGHCTASIVPP